jgi:uridine kinase
MNQKSFVICIAGTAGSGKTTLAHKISKQLYGAPLLSLDDYFEFLEGWPKDIRQWLDKGGKMSNLSNPKMIQDIKSLLDGNSIIHPKTKEEISSKRFIMIEDPSGKERPELAALIDYLVFIDLPEDIGLLRIVQRMINQTSLTEDGTYKPLREIKPEQLINQIMNFLNQYSLVYRDLYATVCNEVHKQADLVIDGQKDTNSLALEVVDKVQELYGKEK